MPFATLRRTLLAFALVVPTAAAHPTETAPAAVRDGAFDGNFADYRQLPAAPVPGTEAVDMTSIEHSQPGPDEAVRELGRGTASYYGARFDGRPTASGERFDMSAMTAAHRTLPFGSKVRVTNPANGKSVVVRINDRGPFHKGRMIDVSHAAARQLGLIARGHGEVALTLLD